MEITTQQIRTLEQEALVSGDVEQVYLCRRAMQGDADAMESCAQAIAAARAMS